MDGKTIACQNKKNVCKIGTCNALRPNFTVRYIFENFLIILTECMQGRCGALHIHTML